MTRDLRLLGPLGAIDRAVELARDSFRAVCLPAWAGGALFAGALLVVYYVERVEGIASLRLPLAVLVVVAWWGRALAVGSAARQVVHTLWDTAPPVRRNAIDVLRTSMVVGFGLWVWSWLLVAGSLAGPVGVLFVAPLLALRGMVAPSWIARASCEPDAGFRAFFRAVVDTHGRRFAGLLIEGMLLAGALGLAVNLYGFALLAVVFGRSFIGLELATIETFLSPSNTFVLLAVASLALVALEPVRAALAALAYVDVRVRSEGLDLHAAIDTAIEHATRHAGPALEKGSRAAAVLALVLFVPGVALAQPLPADEADAPPDIELTEEDREVAARIDQILARSEFRELDDNRGEDLLHLLERFLEWLFGGDHDAPQFDAPKIDSTGLPGPWFFLGLALVLLVGVAVYLWLTRKREEKKDARAAEHAPAGDPRDRAPSAFLHDAAELANEGDLRAALRALYLATLVALDRRRLIAFDPHLTNWQYLRQMPRGEAREAFAQLTRLFDHKWYGHEPTTRGDYERCRALAHAIVGESEQAEAA